MASGERAHPVIASLANAVLDAQVAAMHAGSQRSYGRPRIVRGLRAQGVPVSHERVPRVPRLGETQARTSISGTSLATGEGWLFVMDLAVGWSIIGSRPT